MLPVLRFTKFRLKVMFDVVAIKSGKFGEVVRNIESLRAEGHKLLIFSQFVKHLKLNPLKLFTDNEIIGLFE